MKALDIHTQFLLTIKFAQTHAGRYLLTQKLDFDLAETEDGKTVVCVEPREGQTTQELAEKLDNDLELDEPTVTPYAFAVVAPQ